MSSRSINSGRGGELQTPHPELRTPNSFQASDRLTSLRDRYLELTNQILPKLAQQRRFPVKFNHCFQRIILDNLFGCCWYEVLDRSQGPAYKQLTLEQLEQAIGIARSIIAQPDAYSDQLNQNSLRWRGKSG